MNLLDIIIIGIGLSMDAFAITIANCISYKNKLTKINEWSMPTMFALFQGIMPLIGFLIGSLFFEYIQDYAKYLTFGIFLILAIKVIIDVIKEHLQKEEKKNTPSFSFVLVLIQAFATSIDALIIGFTLNCSVIPIHFAVLIIAVVTFIIVSFALFIGKNLGLLLGKYANYVSAAIMLFLAIKCLIV